ILDGVGARRTVVACSPAARQAGVRRGQRVRDAQRLCPSLTVHPRDEQAEARTFEPVVAVAEGLAAAVEVVRPGLIALGARGPARYHGGEHRLAMLFRDEVAELTTRSGSPIGCGTGIADGMFAASLAARRPGDEPLVVEPGGSAAFLAPFPLAVLDRPDLAGTLDRLGVRSLGALAALPAGDVGARFGADGIAAHRLARGLDPRPPAPRRPAEECGVVHEFDPPAEADEPVVFVAKMLADRLHALLGSAGLSCVRVEIGIATAGGRECVRMWRHGNALGGALSALAVAERVRWQLDSWRAREAAAEQADPVVLLRLTPDQLMLDTGAQQALWGREEVPDRVGRAAEHAQALLGHGGVLRLFETGGRDPGARIVPVAWGDLPQPDIADRTEAPWPGAVPPPAPPHLPGPAVSDSAGAMAAELRDAAGDPVTVTGRARVTGAPAVLVVAGESLPVTRWAGPWPYDERRWDPGRARRRARVQCETPDGRAWLLVVEGGSWRVEGVYQ
ncbi:MAG TPA: DNA polymerase Y family protein, partial [Actinocrinis sp.]|uniref:DNA polymerase Y family protein n=1 Tax=Actinocrinis sp. TaxID=1920516 RepID=UPI002DDCBD88